MEKKVIKGAIFDLDGTLVHTTVDFRLMKIRLFKVLADEGIPSSLLDDKATMSRNLALVRQHVLDHGLVGDMDRISAAVTASMNSTEMEGVAGTTAIDGTLRCLRTLQENGILIGLLTRGSRSYAKAALHHAGIDIPFRAMVCRDDHPEDEAKPNGKALIRTMSMMDLQPRDCLLVGDHVMDMECAASASVRFLGVLSGSFTQGDWERYGCPSTIESVGMLLGYLKDGNLHLPEGD